MKPVSDTVELAATPLPRSASLLRVLRFDGAAVGAWTLGLAPVLYLGLRGGGYDQVIYSEVGLAVWWIALLGVLIGVLPLGRIPRAAWGCTALLGAFAIWTAIAASWSTSAGQTMTELGRLATYLGFLVLGLLVIRRDTVRPLMNGMGIAFGVISLLAVLSRIYPGDFPTNSVNVFFPGSNVRLNYPLNYADGTGEFLAIGIPLLMLVATRARTFAGQAVGAAAVPVAVLGLVMTASRGGVLTAVVGVVAFYALSPDRLPKLTTGVVAAAGSAILVAGLLHRHAIRNGLAGPLATTQRHQLMVLVVVTCVGVALAQAGLALAVRYAVRPRTLRVPRPFAIRATLGAVVVIVVVCVAVGVPGKLSHQWNVFKQTNVTGVVSGNVYSRLGTVSGSRRYQYWHVALQAFKSKPLTGIGPGTYQFYWAQHGPIHEYIHNAHSLYLETLAETGLVGGVVLIGFLLVLLVAGIVKTLRAPPLARAALAAATASLLAFCAAAGFDWVWQLPAIPVAALLLGAAILVYRPADLDLPATGAGRPWVRRVAVVGGAIAALIAVAIPFAATSAIRSSQGDVRAGNLAGALSEAATAQRLEPYAAAPRLQRALILQRAGDLDGARAAIAEAEAREPTNWQIWLVAAEIDGQAGNVRAAVSDYRRAHALAPLDPVTAING